MEQLEGPEASGLCPGLLVERATLCFSEPPRPHLSNRLLWMMRDSIYQRRRPQPGSRPLLSYHFLPLSLVRKSSLLKIHTEPCVKHVNLSISLNPSNTSVQRVPLSSRLPR